MPSILAKCEIFIFVISMKFPEYWYCRRWGN